MAPSVLEADVVADLAGGSGSGLGQEEPPVGADADLVDALPGPGRGGGGRGLALGQPHQPDPAGVQGNLGRGRRQRRRVRKPVRPEPVETSQQIRFGDFYGSSKPSWKIPGSVERTAKRLLERRRGGEELTERARYPLEGAAPTLPPLVFQAGRGTFVPPSPESRRSDGMVGRVSVFNG